MVYTLLYLCTMICTIHHGAAQDIVLWVIAFHCATGVEEELMLVFGALHVGYKSFGNMRLYKKQLCWLLLGVESPVIAA